jgi:hypothetical protein
MSLPKFFEDSFENNFYYWHRKINNAIIDSNVKHSGNHSLKCASKTDGVQKWFSGTNGSGTYNDFVIEAWVYFPNNFTNDLFSNLIGVPDKDWNNWIQAGINYWSSAFQWVLTNHATNEHAYSPNVTINPNQWYKLRFERVNNGVSKLWVDDVLQVSLNTANVNGAGNAELSVSEVFTVYFDDVAIYFDELPMPTIQPVAVDNSMQLHTVVREIYNAMGERVVLYGVGTFGDFRQFKRAMEWS